MKPSPPICNYEDSDYQETFWEKGGRAYEDAVEGVALKRLLPPKGHLMLELGAGAGRNTHRYQNFDQVILLDYSRTQLKQAQSHLGTGSHYRYVAADIYCLPFEPGLFDAATMIRTLHHMAEPLQALQQVRDVLGLKATFILEFANKRNVKAIARYLLRRQKWSPFSLESVEFTELNFDFHPSAVRDWLKLSSFTIEKQLTVSHFRMRLLKRLIPLKLLVGMDSLAQWTGEWWQYTPSVFVRARAVGEGVPAGEGKFFCCPVCGTSLQDTPPLLVCRNCGKSYPVEEGIYDFRLDAVR